MDWLHPYDDVERRFRHTDTSTEKGCRVVGQLLRIGTAPSCDGLLYDLRFYSGGIGVIDRLAISLPASPQRWDAVATGLQARTPEELSGDEIWGEEFLWLVCHEDDFESPRQAAVEFINGRRQAFQATCQAENRILFEHGSNVNDWVALWGDDTLLNYLGYSQG